VAAFLAGCPGGGRGGESNDDTFPEGGIPGPALEDPPPADPSALGHELMQSVALAYQDRWHGFLENCRLRLPSDHALNDASLVATVSISIDSKGGVNHVELGVPSGNDEFDAVALEVVRDVRKFAVPGDEVLSDDGLVHVTWTFARDRRQAGLASASVSRTEFAPDKAVPMLLDKGRFAEAARRASRAEQGGVALADLIAEAAIVAALGSKDVEAQRAAVKAAGAVRLKTAAPALRALAKGAADIELRKAAVAALGSVGDVESVPMLAELLSNGGEEGQLGAAAGALHALGASDRAWELLEPSLNSKDENERWKSLVALAHFPATDAVPKLAALLEGPGPRGQRLAAAAALGAAVRTAGAKAAKPLVAGLAQKDAAVRAACAQAIADAAQAGYQGKVAYWELVKLVKDRDERVRAAAALGSALLGKEGFATEMYRLRKETVPAVLAALAEGLGSVPGDASLQRLLGLAEHEDVAVRRGVARSLRRRSEDAAKNKLASWVEDEDVEIRLFAISALTDEGALRALFDTDEAKLKAAALWRLAVTDGRPAVLSDMLKLMADAPSAGQRATIAGGWLSAK